MIKKLFILLLIAANFGSDQLSKNIVRREIATAEIIAFLDGHLVLTRVENTGAFLSTGENINSSVKLLMLALLPLIFLCFGIVYLMRKTDLPQLLVAGMSFVIGGGLGNIYDRIIYGSVTDFLYLDFYIFQTGIFNLADLSVWTGLIMIATHLYYKKYQQPYGSNRTDI